MIVRNILASVGVLLLFTLALAIFFAPFCVRFEDDVRFFRGRKSARRIFRKANRHKSFRKFVFWDIRKSVFVEYYVLFWIFLVSYVLFVVAMIANIWLKSDWLLFVLRVTAVMVFLSLILTSFSRRFTLYRGNRIRNRKAYAEKEREKFRQRTAKGNVMRAIATALGIPLLSLAIVYFAWYANLFVK